MPGAIPPFSKYVFTAWCLVKHRDSFTLWIMRKQSGKVWTGFIWLRIGISDGLM
jgi:hypothetical protein